MTDRENMRDLLGMRSPAAWTLVTVFCAIVCTIAVRSDADGRWWQVAAAAACTLACAGLMCLPGDPLPTWYAMTLAALAPAACAVVIAHHPTPVYHARQDWIFPATTVFLVFMCVRGATAWAWIGWLARTAVFTVVTVDSARGAAGAVTMNVVPLLVATYFAITIRPTARTIFRLRTEAEDRAADEAAANAALDERDAQLDRLDAVARPLLTRIAEGAQLTPAEQQECRLLEAQLRDRLRAGLIVDDTVADAARAARARGVSVTMLDDGGLVSVVSAVRDAVRRAVADALTFASAGSVAVRVLPPGREHLATVLVRQHDAEYRIEVDPAGHVRSDLAAGHVPGVARTE